jgi:hypothetical protein
VIARNSSFTYKGKAVDVRQVARELGVRSVLEAERGPSPSAAKCNFTSFPTLTTACGDGMKIRPSLRSSLDTSTCRSTNEIRVCPPIGQSSTS